MIWRMALFTVLAAVVGQASAAGMYAFDTSLGTQFGMQDITSGKIWYSNCNNNGGNIIFPTEKPNVLVTNRTVRNGTALAAAGWAGAGSQVFASIFYQTNNSQIVNGFYQCDTATGKLVLDGEYPISQTANVDSVHPQTGLAVNLLGDKDGYRVFYNDRRGQVMMMGYTATTNWADEGAVSPDTEAGLALGAAFVASSSGIGMTVTFPRGNNIEVAKLGHNDDLWHMETFPQVFSVKNVTNITSFDGTTTVHSSSSNLTLPSWSPNVTSIGLTIDDAKTSNLFYIGTDKQLHLLKNDNGSSEWTVWEKGQSDGSWPEADEAAAGLAVTASAESGEMKVFYQSGGEVTVVSTNNNGEWQKAEELPTETPGSGNKSSGSTSNGKSSGLSTGAKAGVGVGVTIGVAAMAGLCLFICMRRRRYNNVPASESGEPSGEPNGEPNGSKSTYQTTPELSGQFPYKSPSQPPPVEMGSMPPPVEMEQPNQVYEMPSWRH